MQNQLQIIPVPAFKDNYIWLVHNGAKALVVDPGDDSPALDMLESLHLELETILITHHHQDHIGGVIALIKKFPDVKVYAPKLEHYDFKHIAVSETDSIKCADWLEHAKVLDLPGHTLGHIGYYIEHENEKWLFCGDTLFGAGCGRLFEGTPAQMYATLQKLAKLPAETKVYCTHEYTLHNINFALSIEPNNAALSGRQQNTAAMRNAQLPSLPSTIGLELATNPFLRCDSKEIQASIQLKGQSELNVFTKIRELRNHY